MKYKLMKRAAAVMASAAMAVSLLPYAGHMDVSAKAPFVKLHTAFKTLTVGQAYKLKLKNNVLGWKVTKAASKDSNVCKAVNKKTYVKLAAKSEGRTTVWVTLKTAKRKGTNATKRLSCRVNVKPLGTMEEPGTPAEPQEPETRTGVTVGTQAELDEALANQGYTKIMLQTNEPGVFTIPAGEYASVDFTVNAPNADVENHAVFRSVTIQDIKENTWKEYAKGNLLKILDEKASLVIGAAASVKEITYAGTGASAVLKLDVHGTVGRIAFQTPVKAAVTVAEEASVSGIQCSAQKTEVQLDVKGTVGSVGLEADVALGITGNPKAAVAVNVAETAKGSQVKASAKVAITVKAEISIQLEKGAQGSKVEITVKDVAVSVENKTGMTVDVKKADGTTRKVANNTVASVTDGQTGTQGSASMPGSVYTPSSGSSSSSTNGASGNKIDLSNVLSNATASVSGTVVVTGTALAPVNNGVLIEEGPEKELIAYGVITEGALKLNISPIKIPEGVQLEDGDEYRKELENGLIIDLCQKGDHLPSRMVWRVYIGVISGNDLYVYFDVMLKREKWISSDGKLEESDWMVEKISQERFEELANGKS